MGRYQAYPEYKNSGIRWVDRIPSTWSTTPIKSIAKIVNGATPKSGVEEFWDGDVAWITPADMGKQPTPYINSGARNITAKGYESCGTSLVPAGAIVLSARAPIGSLAIALNKLCTNQGCKSLIPTEKIHNKFLYYVLNSSTEQLNVLGRGTTFLELSADELGCFSFSLPPIEEQSVIANFLDHETAKIDTLIEKQQQLIQLLKEKRQAVISHAVTKGLNPNAPMKDSGVEWLGDVPEHWIIKKFSHCVAIRNGLIDPTVLPYMDYVLIAPNHIESETGVLLSLETAIEQGADSGKYLCKKGEVIYSKIRPALAKACISPSDETICSADMYPMQGMAGLSNEFLYLTLLSNWFTSLVVLESDRVAMPKINREKLADIRLPVPPQSEQEAICLRTKDKISSIDHLLNKAHQAIVLMQERRTALISAAVTGKIDVRNFSAQLT